MTNLAGVVQQLREERDQAVKVLKSLEAAIAVLSSGSSVRRMGARKLSAAGRARIAAAQRARWAKARGKVGQRKPNVVRMPAKKKTMSAAGRLKIALAQKARWARVKVAKKKLA